MESGKIWEESALDGAVEILCGAIVTPEARPDRAAVGQVREKRYKPGPSSFRRRQSMISIISASSCSSLRKFKRQSTSPESSFSHPARMAKYMTDNVPGIFVPQNLIDELDRRGPKAAR